MNYFCTIFSRKFSTIRNFKESPILNKRVERRISYLLKATNMKYWHKEIWPGTGGCSVLLTSVPVSKDFADKLWASEWKDAYTNEPRFILPPDWKQKNVKKSTILKMENIK